MEVTPVGENAGRRIQSRRTCRWAGTYLYVCGCHSVTSSGFVRYRAEGTFILLNRFLQQPRNLNRENRRAYKPRMIHIRVTVGVSLSEIEKKLKRIMTDLETIDVSSFSGYFQSAVLLAWIHEISSCG